MDKEQVMRETGEWSCELEITPQQLEEKRSAGALLVDIRDESSIVYGMIPGARAISREQLAEQARVLSDGREVIIYCARGQVSLDDAIELRQQGICAYSLKGGYMGWLMDQIAREDAGNQSRAEDIRKEGQSGEVFRGGQAEKGTKQSRVEEGLRKTWHKCLFSRFAKAVKNYELVQEGDRIAVCISGGKDSMLMAKLFQELQRHQKVHFDLVFLVMDPGYSEANRRVIEHNARILGIPVTIFETKIFDIVYDTEQSPCYLCARMRRGYLYSKARELGCNKIALGHHYDDVIETVLMGMLYGGQVQTMMPKLHSANFEGMELIRPMYLIREADIIRWRDANELHFIQCACHFTDTCTTCDPNGRTVSKRMEVKRLIAELKKTNPFVESNIFKSMENVNLDTVIGYKKNNMRHSFLECYGSAHEGES